MLKIVLLGNQYTPANFTMDSLKLNDRPRAEALLRAAELAGFYAKPGLVTSYQMGELLFESRPYRRGRRRYYDDYQESDNEESADEGTMGEVYDEYLEVEHWMPGGVPTLQGLQVEENDLISPVKLNEDTPVEKEATEYTGNAGMEMQYWYHCGAVFLWPRKHHDQLLAAQPLEYQLEWIAYYNQNWNNLSPTDRRLIQNWLKTICTIRASTAR